MSGVSLRNFSGEDDAKAEIVRQIISIVNKVVRSLSPGEEDPLDEGMPDG
jgi:hypothetical protein